MDLKTILVLTAISNLLIFFTLFLFVKLSIVRNKIFNIYTYGKFIQSIGWMLLILRGLVPDIASIGIANSFIIIGFGTEIFSISSYNRTNLKHRAKIFGVFAVILVLIFLILTNFKDNVRIAFMSFVFFIWVVIAAQQLIVFNKKNKLQLATGITYLLFSLFPLARAISVPVLFKTDSLFDPNAIQSTTYSALFLFNFVSTLLFLLLLKGQDETLIKQSEEKYRNFAEFLPQIVFEINSEGEFVYLNKQAYKILGFSPNDVNNGLNIRDLFVKEDIGRALKKIEAVMSGKEKSGTEYRVQKKTGEIFPVLIYSSPIIESNKVLGLRGIIVDITNRKKADQQIKKLSIAVEQSANTIVLTDIEGKIEYTNPKFTEVTGYTAKEAMGLNPSVLNSGIQPKEYYKVMWETIAEGNIWKGEFCNKKKNGDLYWEQVTITPIKDDAGEIISYLAIKEDITAKRDAETALKKSEEKFRIVADYAYDWEYWTDLNENFVYVSPSSERISGYKPKEFYEDKGLMAKIIHPDDKELFLEHKHNVKKNSERSPLEFRVITKNKEIHWIGHVCRDVYGEDGEFIGIRGNNRLITEHKKAEQALVDSEEKYRLIVETASDWIWEIDKEGKYTYSSPRILSVLGYTEEEIIGKTPFDLMPEAEKDRVSTIFEDIVKHNKTIIELENINIHKNGSLVVMETSGLPFFDANGELLGYRGIDRDVTLRNETEQALKESEERLRLAQNAGKIGIWEWNVEMDQIVWSDMTYEIFGLQKKEEIMSSDEYFKHIHPEDKQRLIAELDVSLENKKEEHRTEYRIIVNDKVKWINETSRIITKSGKLVKMIGVLHDITHRKSAQKALKDSEKSLRESNKTKDMFFSIIAHDLKSPFNTMMGFSDLLVSDFDNYEVEQQKKFIGVINQGIHNTYKLLENLLIWSRSQQGTIDFNPEPENLHLLASETISLLGQQYIKKSIRLINKVPEEIDIIADKNMLLTILRNLISNAIKFTPQKGSVEIGCRVSHVKTDGRLSQQDGKNLIPLQSIQIYVKDSGIGILKDKQKQIFEISETISTKGTDGESGTGLGLVLCREFVEKHGGKIWVESEEGRGSKFIFTLP